MDLQTWILIPLSQILTCFDLNTLVFILKLWIQIFVYFNLTYTNTDQDID